MAAVDKFYTNSFSEYQEFCNWVKSQEYITPRGCKVKVSDYVYFDNWTKEDFVKDGKPYDRPVFNSPVHMDNFLYHNCPFEFIRDWLKDRYDGKGYCKGTSDEITKDFSIPQYEPCTRVKVVRKGIGNMPYNKYRWGKHKHKVGGWHIDVSMDEGYLMYNEDIDQWLLSYEEDVWTCSSAFTKKSVKSIIRKILKKWRLPAGCNVVISGRLVGDEWILITK